MPRKSPSARLSTRRARGRVSYVWDGRDEVYRIVAEGLYRPRGRIEEHGRTIVMPNRIRVDMTAPGVRVYWSSLSPDGDGRGAASP